MSVEGPANGRPGPTEGGRIAFENLPAGDYLFRFEHEGFITLERQLTARGGAPIDVNVTLTPAPEPPPPAGTGARRATRAASPGRQRRAGHRRSPHVHLEELRRPRVPEISSLACSGASTATLIQLHDPLTEHSHADFDQLRLVIAGQGIVRMQGHDQPLTPGVFAMIPRGLAHSLAAGGRNPLVLLSGIRPGDHCASGSSEKVSR